MGDTFFLITHPYHASPITLRSGLGAYEKRAKWHQNVGYAAKHQPPSTNPAKAGPNNIQIPIFNDPSAFL
jgi:hypothetical protein